MTVKFFVTNGTIKAFTDTLVSFVVASVTYVIIDKMINTADKIIEKEFIL